MGERKEKRDGSSLITYCDRCGVRMIADKNAAAEMVNVCEDCVAGHNKPKCRAADSSQIPYVEVPTDDDVMRDIRDNVRGR
jgi:hypothetical protein